MPLIIPSNYKQKLLPETTEQAIQLLKVCFQEKLSKTLNLRRITAPLFVLSGTGINDDLNGVERAVTFPIKCMGDRKAEVVHSLAKWKRMKLGAYGIPAGYGLYTDMNAIRSDEELDNLIGVRSRAISRKLRAVQTLDENTAATLLELDTEPGRPVTARLPESGEEL